jgi:RNA polymerase sigma factor (sigma-70 family)
MNNETKIQQLSAHYFKENSGKMIAVLTRLYGIENIENFLDAVQDTFLTAITKWKFYGVPENPEAWLMKVAKNKTINALKKNKNASIEFLNQEIANTSDTEAVFSEQEIVDSQLQLLFFCCNPDLSVKNQIIITLHISCGFGVPEIASALLMSQDAVKKSITRSKETLKNSKKLFNNTLYTNQNSKTEIIHIILYLIFNEGNKATRKKGGLNIELCYEAIRLAKLTLIKDKNFSETNSLLALMFFNLSRFPARITVGGEWLTIEEQDRTLWNKIFIEEGFYYLNQSKLTNKFTKFHIEAIISSIHCTAPTFEITDWKKIVSLYKNIELLEPNSPVVKLNRIVAESYISAAESQIDEINKIGNEFNDGYKIIYFLSKAHIYKKLENRSEANNNYKQALDLVKSDIDKSFIENKIKLCTIE